MLTSLVTGDAGGGMGSPSCDPPPHPASAKRMIKQRLSGQRQRIVVFDGRRRAIFPRPRREPIRGPVGVKAQRGQHAPS
jgi:hypothetical protein